MGRGGRGRKRSRPVGPVPEVQPVVSKVLVSTWPEADAETAAFSPTKCSPTTLERYNRFLPSKPNRPVIPTEIQSTVWSNTTEGTSMIMIAPTSSGKTLAYGVPLIEAATENALILVPTRELAQQVVGELRRASDRATVTADIVAVHGGVDKSDQVRAMQQAKHKLVVAGTPGRLLDVLKTLDAELCRRFGSVVVDEADRMAGQGDLCGQVDGILELVDGRKSMVLASATMPAKVHERWQKWLDGPSLLVQVGTRRIEATRPEGRHKNAKASEGETFEADNGSILKADVVLPKDWMAQIPSNLTQTLHVCAEHKKPRKLMMTLQKTRGSSGLCMVFFNRIKTLRFAVSLLQKEKVAAVELHGQMDQTERQKAVRVFESGRVPILLATDLAARGLHISHVRSVINYDMPGNVEQYVHRCGRAGRSGQAGTVYSFFTRSMAPLAPSLVELLRTSGQFVDPNLLELAGERKPAPKRPKPPSSSDDEDDFAQLSAQRIVLQKSTVQLPSSDNDSSSDEDGSEA